MKYNMDEFFDDPNRKEFTIKDFAESTGENKDNVRGFFKVLLNAGKIKFLREGKRKEKVYALVDAEKESAMDCDLSHSKEGENCSLDDQAGIKSPSSPADTHSSAKPPEPDYVNYEDLFKPVQEEPSGSEKDTENITTNLENVGDIQGESSSLVESRSPSEKPEIIPKKKNPNNLVIDVKKPEKNSFLKRLFKKKEV